MAGHLNHVGEVSPPCLEPSEPHPLGPAVSFRPRPGLDVGKPMGDPWVDEHIAVETQQQRPVRQPPDGRHDRPMQLLAGLLPLPGEGEIVDRHRDARHRRLQQQRPLVRRHRREQQLEDDVAAAEQQGVVHRLVEGAILEKVDAQRVGQTADPLGDLPKVRGAVAQQGVDELQQPRMPTDRPGQRAPVPVAQTPQARQPKEQTVQLGAAEWSDVDPPEQRGTVRRSAQRISTCHEQTAMSGGTGQVGERLAEARVGEAPAVLGEILLEVVEQHQQAVLAQQPPDQSDLVRILVTRIGEGVAGLDQLRDSAERINGRGDQRRRVPATDMHRDSPAVGTQPGQHPPGNRGLADTAGAGQHHAGDRAVPLHRGPATAQHVQRGTDLAAPPDQIPHGQLADGATGRRGERAGKRTRVRGRVEQRRVVGRGQQRRGGVLGRG